MKLVSWCRRAVLVLGMVLGVGSAGGACSSSSPHGCKPSNEPGVCAWTPCQISVADRCAQLAAHGGACVMDWPADPASFCPAFAPYGGLSTADCGKYRALGSTGVDAGATYYYDKASGKLAAIVNYNANFGTTSCSGGPSNFVEPSCGSSQQLSCPDAGGAGASGGSGGAGGMGGGSGADASP